MLLVGLVGAVGCGNEPKAAMPAAGAGNPMASTSNLKYVLMAEPPGAQNIVNLRKSAKDGEDVVVVGRIGGSEQPWVEGRAAFSIVDLSLKPCNEKDDDACKTPWDYCCDTDQLPKSMVAIKFVESDGKTVGADARQLLGVKELQTVVVKGKAKRDEAGNLTVLGEGLFIRR